MSYFFLGLDAHIDQLTQMVNYIQQAHACNEEKFTRFCYMNINALLQALAVDLNNCMLDLKSMGKSPNKVLRVRYVMNIEINIFHL